MTRTAARLLDVVVVGDGFAGIRMAVALRRAEMTDFATVAPGIDYSFEADVDRWRVRARDGGEWRPRIVVLAPGAQSVCGHADAPAPFLGVATHGLPNLFFADSDAQAEYVVKCLAMLTRACCTRIEVRAGAQHEFHRRSHAQPSRSALLSRRALRNPKATHYDLTVPADRELPGEYRGPAVLDATGPQIPVLVTLSGYRDPIDGRYHWYGRLSAADADHELPDPNRAAVLLGLPGRDAVTARLDEVDPWGNLRVTGIGEPPFPL